MVPADIMSKACSSDIPTSRQAHPKRILGKHVKNRFISSLFTNLASIAVLNHMTVTTENARYSKMDLPKTSNNTYPSLSAIDLSRESDTTRAKSAYAIVSTIMANLSICE